jgi:hypothetical protein
MVLLGIFKAALIIEYKFHKNFGEVYHDYSNHFNYAVNGVSLNDQVKNVLATDRGVYFNSSDSTVTLPPNELVNEFSMPQVLTVVFWILPEDYRFFCFYCKSKSQVLYLKRYSIESNLAFFYTGLGNSELKTAMNSFIYGKFHLGRWHLITTVINSNVKVFINKSLVINSVLSSNFSLNDVQQCNLGVKDQTPIMGYVWSFFLYDSEETFSNHISGDSTNCLVQGCSACSESVVLETSSGCIPNQLIKVQSPTGSSCSTCKEGCNSESCLTCTTCSIKSCQFENSQILCACPENTTATESTCVCIDSFYFDGTRCQSCLSDCFQCSNNSTCTKCKSLNSEPSPGGCKCKTGFFNTSSLDTSSACLSCGSGCSSCLPSGKCSQCKVSGAVLDLNCECASGFYLSDNKCKPCYSECKECSSFGVCLTCIALEALPKSFGCECLEGYGAASILNSVDSCVKCHEDCLKCESTGKCVICKDDTKIPDGISCKCKEGFYLAQQCEKCPEDCRECDEFQCFSCLDTLALADSSGCYCPEGTFTESFSPLICRTCRSDCKTCSNDKTCDECLVEGADKRDIGCSCPVMFYVKGLKCVKCETWNEEKGSCVFCELKEFFYNGKCFSCPKLCLECNAQVCSKCVEFATVVNGTCVCLGQYEGDGECHLKAFIANVEVDGNFNILIRFSLDLKSELTESDLDVSSDQSGITFTLSSFNARSYKMIMTYSNSKSQKITARLRIGKNVISNFNSSLVSNEFFIDISRNGTNANSQLNSTFSQVGKNSFYVIASISFFISIFNFNFVSFWNFLNSIQIIVYLGLINTHLPLKFKILLSALREVTRVFNMFDFFISEKHFTKLKGRFYDFGIKSYSIFYNAGHLITALIFIFSNDLIVSFFSKTLEKFPKCRRIHGCLGTLNKKFRFNSYIRFIIQSYLDIGVACTIGLQYIKIETLAEVFSFFLSIILSLAIILTPMLSLIFMNKHKDEITQGDSNLMQKYGSLFYELSNDHGLLASFFYFFFFLRRLIFIVILFSLEDYPTFQISLTLILNISVIFK